MIVSVFENAMATIPKKDANVKDILESIFIGHWKVKIDALRRMDAEQYKVHKLKLPAITFSGSFKERNSKGLNAYSNIVVLDIDNIDLPTITNLKNQLAEDPLVYAAFTSPSGKGIKILVEVNTGPEHHLSAFLHLQKEFEAKYCFKVDDSGKDLCRLCFVSADEEMVLRAVADKKVFEVDIRYGEVKNYVMPEGLKNHKPQQNVDIIFKRCISWTERTAQYVKGSRNKYIYTLGCALNRVGVDIEIAKRLTKNGFDLDQKEIDNTIRKAYFQHQAEHGSVEFKDLGTHEFVAPAYVQNYTDDVVVNDIMGMTGLMHRHGIPSDKIYDILSKVGKYYQAKGYIDFKRKSLGAIMNAAVEALNTKVAERSGKLTLEYHKAQDLGRELIKMHINDKCIPTSLPSFDGSMRGGLMPGNFYAVIGVGGTYKSILAQYFSVAAAYQDKAVLYLSGEMTPLQFYERLCEITLQVNFWQATSSKQINEDNIEDIISQINISLKDNLFFVNGTGFGKEAILATIQNIEATTGKKIGLVVIDGLSQMDTMGLQEIPAAINNSEVCKKIAKEANIAVVALIHVSGEQAGAKIRRDNGPFVRGGGKMTSNSDGYFSTSLLVDPESQALDANGDIIFIEDKFYLRYVDKRAGTGTVSAIINVGKHIEIKEEDVDPRQYEVKL